MLKQRIITAVLLAAFVLWALVAWPVPYFGGFLVVVAAACAWEWSRLGNLVDVTQRILFTGLVAGLVALVIFYALGLLKLMVPLAMLLWLGVAVDLKRRPVIAVKNGKPDWPLLALAAFMLITAVAALYLALDSRSPWYVVYIIAIVAAADIGAYFTGRRFGRRKLAVKISQGKTIEGALGGMAAAVALTMLVIVFIPAFSDNILVLFVMSLLAALLSVVGDLFISRAKRTVGVKDSGKLLPGHGGVLDRFDGLLAATPWLVMPLLWVF